MDEQEAFELHYKLALYYLKKDKSDYDDKLIALSNLMIIKDKMPNCYKMVCDTMLKLDYISKEKIDQFFACLLEYIKYCKHEGNYFDVGYSLLFVFSNVYLNLENKDHSNKEKFKKYIDLDYRLDDFKIDELLEITKIKNKKKRAEELKTYCNIIMNRRLNNDDIVKAMNGEVILNSYIKKALSLIGE